MSGKCVIFSAPSGSGKTTIVKSLLSLYGDRFEFSISATTRAPRGQEQDGRDYHFMSEDHFRALIDQDAFIEWEMVYPGCYYGTLKSEIERIWSLQRHVLFDVDVKGGINLKKQFGRQALSIFVQAPSIEVLRSRLEKRSTDSIESIETRIDKAMVEMQSAKFFDVILINDDLNVAIDNTKRVLRAFLGQIL